MAKIKFSVPVHMYCSNEPPRLVDVDALPVGRLAIHRPVHWFRGQEPKPSTRYWEVSHIGSGLAAGRAMPDSLRQPYARRRDLVAWAERWQQDANVGKLLDAADAAAAEGRQMQPGDVDLSVVTAAREAGWRTNG